MNPPEFENLKRGEELLPISRWQDFLRRFAAERDWDKFHTPKNLAMALAGEAGELLEIFQWLTEEESKTIMDDPKQAEKLRHELADILIYLLRLADKLEVALEPTIAEKMSHNAAKYPVEKSRGSAKKYTEL